jgi:ABC-type amino acid transport substrate-binding protein
MSAGNDRILARALVSAMNDDVGQPPGEVLARVLGETELARPLPRFVALVVEPPIVMPARVVVGIRRSRLLMIAAALLIATTFVASGIAGAWVERLMAPSKPPDALERLQSLGTVRIAISPDGAADSFDADVARALAERLGLPLSVVAVAPSDLAATAASWDVALPMVPESRLDRDDFAVTEPFYSWPREVLVPTESGGTSLADVQGQPICAVAGDLGERWLMGALGSPGPSLASVPPLPSAMILRDNDAACLAALEEGTVRAVVTAAMSPADVSARTNLQSVADLPPEPRAIVVSRDGPDPSALIAAIEATLDDMRRDGTLGRYSTTRFGADLTVQP